MRRVSGGVDPVKRWGLRVHGERMRPSRRVLLGLMVMLASTASAQERGVDLASPTVRGVDLASQAPPASAPEERAEAEPTSASRVVGIEVWLGTRAPIDLGLSARLVFFERLYLHGDVGAGVYGGLFDLVASRLASEDAGTVARRLAHGAFVGRIGLGVRPFGDEGPELSVAYLGIRRSASVDAATLAAAAGMRAQPRDVEASLRIAAVHVELGWSLRVGERWLVRPTIGWAHGLRTRMRLEASTGASAAERAALASVEDTLTRGLRARARTPTLGVQLGLRF